MIDALREEADVQRVPMNGFVGIDRGIGADATLYHGNALGLGLEHEGERPTIALAHDDDNAALAGLIAGKAAVDPVFLEVGGADAAAEVPAINLDLAFQAVNGGLFGGKGLAELVSEHERRLVLHVKIAAELQRRMPLGTVDEDGDGEEVIPDRQLTAGKDRARGYGELPFARLALVDLARLERVGGIAPAMGAHGLAMRLGPADATKGIMRFLVRHSGHLGQREGTSGGGEKEMLSHDQAND